MSLSRKQFLLSPLAASAAAGAQTSPRSKPSAPASAANGSVPGRAQKLAARIAADFTGAETAGAVYLGDALGLFKAMAGRGPMQAKQLAELTKLNERYLLEWLRAMAAASYIDYHVATQSFELPAEHDAVLVNETSPFFSVATLQAAVSDLWMVPKVATAFRSGRGVPYSEYPPESLDATERRTRPFYVNQLVQRWLPAVPGLAERLNKGCSAADLGCGGGVALIELAKAFPRVRSFGYDPYAPNIRRATQTARNSGVADRVAFNIFDGRHVPGGPYGLITILFSFHHVADPIALLNSSRSALEEAGVLLVVEARRSERLEEDINSPRQVMYSAGLLECLPVELSDGAPGYGLGMQESELRRLASECGFREIRTILPEGPLLMCALRKG